MGKLESLEDRISNLEEKVSNILAILRLNNMRWTSPRCDVCHEENREGMHIETGPYQYMWRCRQCLENGRDE